MSDHAAEARKILDEYEAADADVWELADETEATVRHDAFTLAQVHATLALVEQQRIANLIAYWRMHLTHTGRTQEVWQLPGDDGVDTTVRAALGLETS